MECWHCERPAHAVCRFCGRAVCKSHAKEMPYVVDTYRTTQGEYKALVIANTIYCGVCQPQQEPVVLKNME
ncbi:MAG: hypothetical protein KA314_26815 [Chloroflexi bacterium]|nr:hypothetical protein [Chloroflexota bacterium]MBP8059464.1 hypothetical protein [Chloroflexota bacterium]